MQVERAEKIQNRMHLETLCDGKDMHDQSFKFVQFQKLEENWFGVSEDFVLKY